MSQGDSNSSVSTSASDESLVDVLQGIALDGTNSEAESNDSMSSASSVTEDVLHEEKNEGNSAVSYATPSGLLFSGPNVSIQFFHPLITPMNNAPVPPNVTWAPRMRTIDLPEAEY